MAHIQLHREHSLDQQQARRAAEEIAAELDDAHNMHYYWDGDMLHFERTGVRGFIRVDPDEVYVEVKLGLLLLPMRGFFEDEIERRLDEIAGLA